MVVCIACKEDVSFYANGLKCRECYNTYMREYMLNRYYERRNEAVKHLGGKCIDCGSNQKLEFDHIDPKLKEFDIGKFWSYSKAKFWKEIGKCVLRCEECHLIKTKIEKSVPHGGGLTGKKNCLCDLCRPLKNAYARNWKRLNKQGTVS